MKFCFILRLNHVGGCETLVARMSSWILAEGHSVTVLTDYLDPSLEDCFPKDANIIQLNSYFDRLQYPLYCRYVIKKYSLPSFDVIKSVYVDSCYIASVIANLTPEPVKVIAGMYSPKEFSRYKDNILQPFYHRFLVDNFTTNISPKSRIACFTDLIKELMDNYGSDQSAIYWPLPIANVPDSLPIRNPVHGKLVSIGRIAPMKEYNIWMVDIVKGLLDNGYDISYHIYGYGSYEEDVKTRIQTLGLNNRVFMHGSLAYNKIKEVLSDAYAFIGMGTSVIEAAQQGVPSFVVPAFDDKRTTFGMLYDFPTECIQQQNVLCQESSKLMYDELEKLLRGTTSQYQDESEKNFEYSKYWSMDSRMNEFMTIIDHAPIFKKRLFYYQYNYLRALTNRLYKILFGKEVP